MGSRGGIVVIALMVAGLAAPVLAEDVIPAVPSAPMATDAQQSEWQAVISGQIAALRTGDAAAALGFAGAEFRKQFTDPAQFLQAVAAWGYGPLITSQAESFGQFAVVSPDEVVQALTVIGKDMVVYRVVYDLGREPEGWRVKAVQMTKTSGMGA